MRLPQEWELRHQAAAVAGARRGYDERVHEFESEEDDGQGVRMDANGYVWNDDKIRQRGGFAGDELYFDGYDMERDSTPVRQQQPQVYDYLEDPDSEEEFHRQRAYQEMRMREREREREREDALVKSALERVARARAKGRTNVDLSQDEVEALERRRGGGSQQPEHAAFPPAAPAPALAPVALLASPPATPASAKKGKVSSRSSSSTSLVTQKTRKSRSASLFSGQSSPSPAKANHKAKVDRKPSSEQPIPYPASSAGQPGIMVQGPNGVPVFAPLVNFSPELARAGVGVGGRTRSRSTSKHTRRESTPPERTDLYAQYPPPLPQPRYYPPPAAGGRPDSSASNRSLPPADEIDWYGTTTSSPSPLRPSTDHYADYYAPPPNLPAAQVGGPTSSRRNVSGSSSSPLRRMPPSSSPLAPTRVPLPHAQSDPASSSSARRRVNSQKYQQLERTSSGGSDGSGSASGNSDPDVQVRARVDIVDLPDVRGEGGWGVSRAPAVSVPVSGQAVGGGEGRRRKSGRR